MKLTIMTTMILPIYPQVNNYQHSYPQN